MKLRATILGSGSSGGVPRIGNHWGACDPAEPLNRRTRCSMLVEQWDDDPAERTVVLIDTSPDMREQLLRTDTDWADGVLYTHDHADQANGIDDLRMLALNRRRRVDVWMDKATTATLTSRFSYCFTQLPGSGYPAILNHHLIEAPLAPIAVEGPGGTVTAIPFDQDHGEIRSLGFRIGPLAYSSDLVDLPEESFGAVEGVECWVVDALRYTPHPSHAHVDKAVGWIERISPKLGVLTNLHIDLDYRKLAAELPEGIIPAYDGMVLEFDY